MTYISCLRNDPSHGTKFNGCGREFRNIQRTQHCVNIMDLFRPYSDKIWDFPGIVNVKFRNGKDERVLRLGVWNTNNEYYPKRPRSSWKCVVKFFKIVCIAPGTIHVTLLFPWRNQAQNASYFHYFILKRVPSFTAARLYIRESLYVTLTLIKISFKEPSKRRIHKPILLARSWTTLYFKTISMQTPYLSEQGAVPISQFQVRFL